MALDTGGIGGTLRRTSGESQEMREWEPAFRDYLLGLGLDPKTVTPYVAKLRRVERWAVERGYTLDNVTARQVSEMAHTFPQTPSSLGHLRAALKHYWESTQRFPNPYKAVRLPRIEPPPPRPLEIEQTQAVIKTSMGWFPEGLAVLSGLYLGLRRETIAMMRWDGFLPDLSWYKFRTKNRRVLTRPVHPILRSELAGHETAYVWLFPGQRGRAHVNPATVGLWVARVAKAAGVEYIQPHRLRHTILTEMYDRTKDLRATAEFAGHQRTDTTQRYTRVTARRLEEQMMALDYFAEIEEAPPEGGARRF